MQHAKRTQPRSSKRVLISGAAGLLALGVSGGSAFAASVSSPTITPQSISASAPSTSSSYATSLNLQAMPAGTVSFHRGGGKLVATISAFGLTPGSTHLAEITPPGNDAPIMFSQFTASSTGQVSATITSVGSVGRLSSHAVFQIELTTSPGQPIAVANVGPLTSARSVHLFPVETSAPLPLAGHANLSYNGGTKTLTVTVNASGFVPNTTHAAHVHTGSCEAQGAPIIVLQDLRADANGRIAQTDVIQNVASFTPASGLYLNIHEGSSATILDAAGNPTPQFRPLLCANLPASSMAVPGQGSRIQQGDPATQAMRDGGNNQGRTEHAGKKSPSHVTAKKTSGKGPKHILAPAPLAGKGGGSGKASSSSEGGTAANGTTSSPGGSAPSANTSGGSASGGSPAPGGTATDTPDTTQLLTEANTLGQQAEALAQALAQPSPDLTTDQSQLTQLQADAQNLGQQFHAEMAGLQSDSQQYSVLADAESNVTKSIGDAQSALAKDMGSTSSGTDPTQSTTPATSDQPPATDAGPTSTDPAPAATDPAPAPDPAPTATDPAPAPDPAPAANPGGSDLGGGDGGGD